MRLAGIPRVFFVSLLALLLSGALPAPAEADHAWASYHWGRQSNPFTLELGDNVTSAWDSYLETASSEWSESSVLDTLTPLGSVNPKRCTATAGRVEVCNASYGRNGWLGLASIWATGGHITQGTAKMNDTYFSMSAYNNPAWRSMVMCQEIGHTFGLGHTDETQANANQGTCMDYTNDPDGGSGGGVEGDYPNISPNQHDYDQLATIYGHLDGTTTVGTAAARTAGQSGIEIPDPVGPERGGVSVFRTDLGDNTTVTTYVIWADANVIGAANANPNAPIATEGVPAASDGVAASTSVSVTSDEVNLRSGPSRQAEVVAVLGAGTTLTVTGAAESVQGITWVPVATAEGVSGYVAADFIA